MRSALLRHTIAGFFSSLLEMYSRLAYSFRQSRAETGNDEPATIAGDPEEPPEREFMAEAATLLLRESTQLAAPRVVVEGAPGQGKSTIAQYVCQVHRMQLLDSENLKSLPAEHQQAARRLPIKVDLRDLATWIGRKNPFSSQDQETPPKNWHKSLEAFLAALIGDQSGGTDFTPDDLLAIVRISAVLLFFDGLDEVADITRRQEIVEEIVKGVQRLESNAASLQVIVTSRPAAFANSPGMPPAQYLYLQLLSLTRPLIMRYADRWMDARRLDSRQKGEFRSVLREKLSQPHLRDLARNPMQLTILLSLVLTRGASLPDKRTALYDSYIDLFISREAEKSPIVREHRELLVDIHRYLAWLLHSEAELGDARATIAQERLMQVVSEYLSREGHDERLARELFTGMVERVVALVSRLEGTFEFEVQPLREYFAACHLYYTAPQSSPGKERPGSKPDRFDAIARNFYWLNVARFYAGCYSKGELPSLVERLQELKLEDGFRDIGHPTILAATLLADWVFTQNPKSVREVAALVLDGTGLYFLSQSGVRFRRRRVSSTALVLPPKCGRDELVSYCFRTLEASPPADLESEVLDVLSANTESPSDLVPRWTASYRSQESTATRLRSLTQAERLGILKDVGLSVLEELIGDPRPSAHLLNVLFNARRFDYLQSSEAIFDDTVSAILDGKIAVHFDEKPESALDALGLSVHPFRYAVAFRDRRPVSLATLLRHYHLDSDIILDPNLATEGESFINHGRSVEFARVAARESERSASEWATDITPWDNLVEAGRATWGDRQAFTLLANLASGIHSSTERCSDHPELLDHSRSLSRRTRFARLRSGAVVWWRRQFDSAHEFTDIILVALVVLTWATTATIVGLKDVLESTLQGLQPQQWTELFKAVRYSARMANFRDERKEQLDHDHLLSGISIRMASVFAMRANDEVAGKLYRLYFENFYGTDLVALQFAQAGALDPQRIGSDAWSPNLDVISRCYRSGLRLEAYDLRTRPNHEHSSMPIDVARAIIERSSELPGTLIRLAEERCRKEVAAKIIPVIQVSQRDGWFA